MNELVRIREAMGQHATEQSLVDLALLKTIFDMAKRLNNVELVAKIEALILQIWNEYTPQQKPRPNDLSETNLTVEEIADFFSGAVI